jgi:hypothetical protein
MVDIAEPAGVVIEVLREVDAGNDTSDGCLLGVRRTLVVAPNFVVAGPEAMVVVQAVVVLANVSWDDGEEVQLGEGCLGLLLGEGCCLTS